MHKRWLPGQSLVEMLIVLFVISVGLFTAVSLIISNLTLQVLDADQTMAMNVAREALELVQNKRDSNWLASSVAFDEGILVIDESGTPYTECTAVPAWDGTDIPDPVFFDFAPNAIAGARLYRSAKPQAAGVFTNVAAGNTATDFYRLLTFSPICQDPADSNNKAEAEGKCECPPAGQPTWTTKIGLRAKADVQWKRNGRQKNLTIYADFYDWR